MKGKSLFPYGRHRFNNEVILDELNDEVLDILLRDQEVIHFRKGEIVFREGMVSQGVYYIRSGMVRKYSAGLDGREFVFYLCGERELLGHHGLINQESNPNSASAMEDSEIVFIPRDNFVKAMDASMEFRDRLMRNLSHEFGVFVHLTKILAQYNVRERTALALLIVNEKYLRGGSLDAVITLSREELASMVGTAKENLVRILSEFKEQGILKNKGHGLVIRDFDALIHLSNYFK